MIGTGTPIQVSGAAQTALIGPVVKDQVGNLLMLTSRVLLTQGHIIEIAGESGPTAVGQRPTAYFQLEGSERSASQLVGWFTPTASIARKNLISKIADKSVDLLAQDVRIPQIGGSTVGYISGLGCYARFRLARSGPSAVIDGLLRVTLNAKILLSANVPLAGGIVTLRDRSLFGIVVGVQGSDLLVVPISDVLTAEGLEMASTADIMAYNEGMKPRRKPKRNPKYPTAVSRIADTIGFTGDLGADWSAVIQEWVALGWQLHNQHKPGAFAPYQELFSSISNPSDLADRLLNFGLNELDGHSTNDLGWEEVLRRIYTSIDFEYVAAFHDPSSTLLMESRTELEGHSSHDRVIRNKAA